MLQNKNIIDVDTGEVYENVTITTEQDRQKYKNYLEEKIKYEFKGSEIQIRQLCMAFI